MVDFAPIIREAYREILEREPDAGGLSHYDGLMNAGLSEAALREALLRSPEYAARNPGAGLAERLGLNVHIPTEAVLDDVAGGLGMRWVRVDFDWFRIEPAQGTLRWEEWDRAVSRAAALGVRVLATLAYTPAWASSNPADPRVSDPPASTAYWTDFVERAVTRFRDRVRHWQFWNEPNITEFWSGSPAEYRTRILEPAASLVRALDPGIQVVAPGLANIRDWRDWLREAAAAASLIDVVNHHNYQRDGREVVLELERDRPGRPSLRTLMRELGVDARPFWLTETGLRSDAGDQLAYYRDVVAVLEERSWVDRLFFYHYWDGPGQGDGGFGIVNEDLSPKPAYRFLQSLLRAAPAAGAVARAGGG